MAAPIAMGPLLLLATTAIAVRSVWAPEVGPSRARHWRVPERDRPERMPTILTAAPWVLAPITADVWRWARNLRGFGVFDPLKGAMHVACVTFTTRGYGDAPAPGDWRIPGRRGRRMAGRAWR